MSRSGDRAGVIDSRVCMEPFVLVRWVPPQGRGARIQSDICLGRSSWVTTRVSAQSSLGTDRGCPRWTSGPHHGRSHASPFRRGGRAGVKLQRRRELGRSSIRVLQRLRSDCSRRHSCARAAVRLAREPPDQSVAGCGGARLLRSVYWRLRARRSRNGAYLGAKLTVVG